MRYCKQSKYDILNADGTIAPLLSPRFERHTVGSCPSKMAIVNDNVHSSGPRLILDPNLDLYGEFTRPVPLAQDWSKTGLWEIEIQSLFLRTRSGLTKLSSEPVALLDCGEGFVEHASQLLNVPTLGSTYTHLPETSFNQICGVLTTFEHDSDLYFPESYSDDPPVLVIVTKNGVRLETAICPQIEKASMEIMTLKKDNARYVVSYVQETIGMMESIFSFLKCSWLM